MNAEQLLEVYEQISEAPDAIARLRRFVLDLAVRGKLVKQDAGDEPAQKFLEKVRAEKARLTQAGVLRKSKALKSINVGDHAFDIPPSWRWARLGDLIDLVSGQHLQPAEYSEDPKDGIPYITGPSDFGDEKLVIRRYALVRKAVATKGQLLLTVKGSGVGKTALCDLDEVAISRQLMALTPILLNAGFLELVAHGLATKLQDEARSLIPGISRDDVNLFAIAVPPLAEQHRIVAKVDELMALCDRLEEARKTREEVRDKLTAASLARLTAPDTTAEDYTTHARFALEALPSLTTRPDQIKTIRQTILNLAVRGKLVEQDPGESLTIPHASIVHSDEPFEIPKGWSWQLFGSLADMINGDRSKNYPNRNEYQPSGIAWINTGHIQPDGSLELQGMHYISREKFDTLRSGKVQPGDLVYCLRGATFGKTGFVEPFEEGAIASSLMIIRLKPELARRFAYHLLMSPYGKEQLLRFDNGTAQPNLSAGNVGKYLIPLPPLAEQHRIVATVDALMALCDRLEAALTTADTTRTHLLEALLHEALEPAASALEAAE